MRIYYTPRLAIARKSFDGQHRLQSVIHRFKAIADARAPQSAKIKICANNHWRIFSLM